MPHFHGKNWNYIKGAFMTIDRPYGKIFDFLHHRIGSTHVVQESESRMEEEDEMKNRRLDTNFSSTGAPHRGTSLSIVVEL